MFNKCKSSELLSFLIDLNKLDKKSDFPELYFDCLIELAKRQPFMAALMMVAKQNEEEELERDS